MLFINITNLHFFLFQHIIHSIFFRFIYSEIKKTAAEKIIDPIIIKYVNPKTML